MQKNKEVPNSQNKNKQPVATVIKKVQTKINLDEIALKNSNKILIKQGLIQNFNLNQISKSAVRKLKKIEQDNNKKESIKLNISTIIKHFMNELEIYIYYLSIAIKQIKQKGKDIHQIWKKYCDKNECFLDNKQFYLFVREVLKDAGEGQNYIDCIYYLCTNRIAKKAGKFTFLKLTSYANDMNPMQLKIKSLVNQKNRKPLRNYLLQEFQRNDLDGSGTLQYPELKKILISYNIQVNQDQYKYMLKNNIVKNENFNEFVDYKKFLEISFLEDLRIKEFCYNLFAKVLQNLMRKKKIIKKKHKKKILSPVKAIENIESFVKKPQKIKTNIQLEKQIKKIVYEIIELAPKIAYQKINTDPQVIKDIIIIENINQVQQEQLIFRSFTSNSLARGIFINKNYDLIQLDLATNTELSRVNLRTSCPIFRTQILDILLSRQIIYILTEDWYLFCWQLTTQTYTQRIQICQKNSKQLNINRLYKNRCNDKFPKYLSDSKEDIIVNCSVSNNKIVFINKQTMQISNTIEINKHDLGLTILFVQKVIRLYQYISQNKSKGKKIFKTNNVSKSELRNLIDKQIKEEMNQIIDYIFLEQNALLSNQQFETILQIIIKKYKQHQWHMEEKNHKILNGLKNLFISNANKLQIPKQFNAETLRKIILTMDRRITTTETYNIYQYLCQRKINQFTELKKYLDKINLAEYIPVKFYDSIYLIFQKCLEVNYNLLAEIRRYDKKLTGFISKIDFKCFLFSLPVGLTQLQIQQLLDSMSYNVHGFINYQAIFNSNNFLKITQSLSDLAPKTSQYDLPNVVIEDIIYIQNINCVVYTTIFPKTSKVFLSYLNKSTHSCNSSMSLIRKMQGHKGNNPPLIFYQNWSGYLISADKIQNEEANIFIWDIRMKYTTTINQIISLNPLRVIKSAHKKGIIAIEYMESTQVIITSSLDGCLKVWDPVFKNLKNNKNRIKIKPGYYGLADEEIIQSCFVESKKILLKEICYSIKGINLKFLLPESNIWQNVQLFTILVGSPRSHYTKTQVNTIFTYGITRMQIQIYQSKWQQQLPKILMNMLEEMAYSRRKKVVNFKIQPIVKKQIINFNHLYKELKKLNYIKISLPTFYDLILDYQEKSMKNKLQGKNNPIQSIQTKSLPAALISQLTTLTNLLTMKRLVPDSATQRKKILFKLFCQKSTNNINIQEFRKIFMNTKVNQQALQQIFIYNSRIRNKVRILNFQNFLTRMFRDKELLVFQKFIYSICQFKCRLTYTNSLNLLSQQVNIIQLIKQKCSFHPYRLQIIEQFLEKATVSQLFNIFKRIPIQYEFIVPKYHRNLRNQYQKLKLQQKLPKDIQQIKSRYSEQFIKFITVAFDELNKQTMEKLKQYFQPQPKFKSIKIHDLKKILQQLSTKEYSLIRKYCESSKIEVEFSMFLNYVYYNTNINKGSLLQLGLIYPEDFDYKQMFQNNYIEIINYSNPNRILRNIYYCLTSTISKYEKVNFNNLLKTYIQNHKISYTKFQKLLNDIGCKLTENQKYDLFYKFLEASILDFIDANQLIKHLELCSLGISVFYDQNIWNRVLAMEDAYVINQFKNNYTYIKKFLTNVQNNCISTQQFYSKILKLYKNRQAGLLSQLATLGSSNDIQLVEDAIKNNHNIEGYIHLNYLQNALFMFKDKQILKTKKKVQFPLVKQIILRRLPLNVDGIPAKEAASFLIYSQHPVSLKERAQFLQKLIKNYDVIPVEELIGQANQEVRNLLSYKIFTTGLSLQQIFKRGDFNKTGILEQNQCFEAFNFFCSPYESRRIIKIINFNEEQVTLKYFLERMKKQFIDPIIKRIKKVFIFKMYIKNKIYLLDNFSYLDNYKSNYINSQTVVKVLGKNIIKLILIYNWQCKQYLSLAEITKTKLYYQPLVATMKNQIKKYIPDILNYKILVQKFLKKLIQNEETLFEIFYITTCRTNFRLNKIQWNTLLQAKCQWYFYQFQINYSALCQHVAYFTQQRQNQQNLMNDFANIVFKKTNLYQIFKFMDIRKSGKITLNQFIQHCALMKIPFNNEDVKQIYFQISQNQQVFTYNQFFDCLNKYINENDRVEWIFFLKRNLKNQKITLNPQNFQSMQKFYNYLLELKTQKFINLLRQLNFKQVQKLLQSVDISTVLLQKFESIHLIKTNTKQVKDLNTFNKLVGQYLKKFGVSKQQRNLMWDKFMKKRFKVKQQVNYENLETQQRIRMQQSFNKIKTLFRQSNIYVILQQLGINKYSQVTIQAIQQILLSHEIVIITKDVKLFLQNVYKQIPKLNYKQLVNYVSDEEEKIYTGFKLQPIKELILQVCNKFNITLKQMFKLFLKPNEYSIKQKYWKNILMNTLRIKVDTAIQFYNYLDDNKNRQIDESQWIRKLENNDTQYNLITTQNLFNIVDIHHMGYIKEDELQILSEKYELGGATGNNLINIFEWILSKQIRQNKGILKFNVKIPNCEKLIDILSEQQIKVYPLDDTQINKRICENMKGITIKKIIKSFKMAGISLEKKDLCYLINYFKMNLNPTFLDLEKMIQFLKIKSRVVEQEENYDELIELIEKLKASNILPLDYIKKLSKYNEISKEFLEQSFNNQLKIKKKDQLLSRFFQNKNIKYITVQDFLRQYDIYYSLIRSKSLNLILEKIDKCTNSMTNTMRIIFHKLKIKFITIHQYWNNLIKISGKRYLDKVNFLRLLIYVGIYDYSLEQINTVYQLLDENKDQQISFYEWSDFWIACEKIFAFSINTQYQDKIYQLQNKILNIYGTYLKEEQYKPVQLFNQNDFEKKGYLNTIQFKQYLKSTNININDHIMMINFMMILDSQSNKNIVRYLPLISKLSNFVNVFNEDQVVHKQIKFQDRAIIETFFKLNQNKIQEYDGDYDGNLETIELYNMILAHNQNQIESFRITQFISDFIGLKVESIQQYRTKLKYQLIKKQHNLSYKQFKQIKVHINPLKKLQAAITKYYYDYRFFAKNIGELKGYSLISFSMFLEHIQKSLTQSVSSIQQLQNLCINNIMQYIHTKLISKIPITDWKISNVLLKSIVNQKTTELKNVKYINKSYLNPYIQIMQIQDTNLTLIQTSTASNQVLCHDNHTIQYHIKSNKQFYNLPVSMTKISTYNNLVIENIKGKQFQKIIQQLQGLLFNKHLREDAGKIAKFWGYQILKILNTCLEYSIVGLLRPNNLIIDENKFGFRHLFMALRVDSNNLVGCGLDYLYSEISIKEFQIFKNNLQDFRQYNDKIKKIIHYAPEIFYNKTTKLTPAIDIYAFGVILFYILFGQYPELQYQPGLAENSIWNKKDIFQKPLSKLLTHQQILQIWKEPSDVDLGKIIINKLGLSQQQEIRDILNIIVLCLDFDWYRRPTVQNLLSTVFSNTQILELPPLQSYYSEQHQLERVNSRIHNLISIIINEEDLAVQKIELLKMLAQMNQKMEYPLLFNNMIQTYLFDRVNFIVLNFSNLDKYNFWNYNLEILRFQIIEVVENYAIILNKLLNPVYKNYINNIIQLIAKSYLGQFNELQSQSNIQSWQSLYQHDEVIYRKLQKHKEKYRVGWNQIIYTIYSPIYKKMLTIPQFNEYLETKSQKIEEFFLEKKIETLNKQIDLQIPKSSIYYFDLISICQCLKILNQCTREQNQSKKSALKIVISYVKSMIASHDPNKLKALLDSKIGIVLQTYINHKSEQIRKQVINLYYQLSQGFLPLYIKHKSAQQIHKNLGILYQLMNSKDQLDRNKFLEYSNNYYGFKNKIVRSILRRVCQCFNICVLSSLFSQWNNQIINIFENLIYSDNSTLILMNSAIVEAFSGFYYMFYKSKDPLVQQRCKFIHQQIIGLNNQILFKILNSNPTIRIVIDKMKLEPIQTINLYEISNDQVKLRNYYSSKQNQIISQLKSLTLQKFDKSFKQKNIQALENLKNYVVSLLNKVIRFIRKINKEKILICSQVVESVSEYVRQLLIDLEQYSQLSLNVQIIYKRIFKFYQELIIQNWQFFFTPQLLEFFLQKLLSVYNYHKDIQQNQTMLNIKDMKITKELNTSEEIIQYILKHQYLRKFMQNKMTAVAHILMKIFINCIQKNLQERLLKISFTSRFCKIIKWQHALLIGYMKTKTQNLHIIENYVQETNFRIRMFYLLLQSKNSKFHTQLIKSNFIEYIVHTLLENTLQFDMRFYRSNQAFLPFRYCIPLRNEGLSMITSIFWAKQPIIYKELENQMLKHQTIRKENEILKQNQKNDMKLLDSLWLFSMILEGKNQHLILQMKTYGVIERLKKMVTKESQIKKYYPKLWANISEY